MESKTILEALQSQGGVIAMFFFIMITGAKGYWEWGRVVRREREVHADQLKDMREQRDEWKAVATNGKLIAQESVETAAQAQEAASVLARYLEAHLPAVDTPSTTPKKRSR